PPYRDFELLATVRGRTVTGQRDSSSPFSGLMSIRRQARAPTVFRSRQLRFLTHFLSFGHLDYRNHAATLPKQVLVLLVLANFQSAKDPILSIRRPVDLEVLPSPRNRSVEDAVRDVLFVGFRDDDFHRVKLETLCLVDRDRVGNLEWHDG